MKAKLKYDLDADVVLLTETVRQRVIDRGSMSGHVGKSSLMAHIEPYLVDLILQL
jgi:hypothetical protein